ncbi:MAG TPA: CvpA family protein [Dongiaceae bacterium]|nr:CvpA family protein [Dongiaceae bacterium]
MNFVDICVLAVIGISALLALSRGLVKEVLSILSWVGAVVAVIFLLPRAEPIVGQYIKEPLLAQIASGIGIFILALVVFGIANHYLSANVRSSALGALDRSLGLVFGIVRGAVVVCVAYILMSFAIPNPASRPDVIREARTEPLVAEGATFLKSLLPADVVDKGSSVIDTSMQKLEQGKALNDSYQNLTNGTGSGTNSAGSATSQAQAGSGAAQGASGAGQAPAKAGGQGDSSGYKDAERKEMERLLQGAQ